MKIAAILLSALALSLPASAGQFLFLSATNDSDLVSFRVDPKSGALTEHARLALPGGGGPMSLAADGKILYVESHVSLEGEKRPIPHIVTLRNDGGSFAQLEVARVDIRSPSIHVDATNRCLLGAHYGDGAVTVWKIDDERRCTGEVTDHHKTEKTAHFITTDPGNRFVYVPHTSPNAIYQFSLDPEKGLLSPLDPPSVSGPDEDHQYHQPRHYAHHPTLAMGFSSNERGGGISSWKFDASTGRLTLAETLSALPPDWEGNSAAADVHITPDGRFVYVSNRDTRKLEDGAPTKDTIAAFSIAPETGKLSLVGHYATEHFPRSFCIDTTGNFVYVAGQRTNQLAAYRIDRETGALERIGTYPTGKSPIWVMCWSE